MLGDSMALLALLIGLELVLGVDNILVISIFVGKLPAAQRAVARMSGLVLAFFGRVLMLFVLLKLTRLTESVLARFSVRDLILLGGGLFLLYKAVIVSFAAILFFAKSIGDFILRLPSLKILALAFLITIGITIFMEGLHQHVPKAYIYLPMGFALLVEILQLRYESNRKRKPRTMGRRIGGTHV